MRSTCVAFSALASARDLSKWQRPHNAVALSMSLDPPNCNAWQWSSCVARSRLQQTQKAPPPKMASCMAWLNLRPFETVRDWLMSITPVLFNDDIIAPPVSYVKRVRL